MYFTYFIIMIIFECHYRAPATTIDYIQIPPLTFILMKIVISSYVGSHYDYSHNYYAANIWQRTLPHLYWIGKLKW